MTTLTLLSLLLCAEPATDHVVAQPKIAFSTALTLKVTDPVAAADLLIAEAEKMGGYFASRTNERLVLKVPKAEHDALVTLIEALGTTLNRNYVAKDLTFDIEQKEVLLRSREEVLSRYDAVLAQADLDALVAVEREMTAQVQAIEELSGALRMLEHELQFARISVDFQFRDRQAPVPNGRSSFAWLNRLNLVDFVGSFIHED